MIVKTPNIIIADPVNEVPKFSIAPTGNIPEKVNLSDLSKIADASRAQVIQENKWIGESIYKPLWTVPTKATLRYNDPFIGYSAFNSDIEQDYADNQSGWESAWRQSKSGFGKFLSTAIGGFSDIPDTIEAVSTQSLDAFSNTTWKNALLEWSDALTEANPVYETRYVKENPWLSFINPLEFKSFTQRWGTVAENLGFTAGAIANAVVTDVALTTLGGGALGSALLPKQIVNISKGLVNLGKAFEAGNTAKNVTKILAQPQNILKELKRISAINTTTDALRTSLNLYNSAVGEASIESYHNFKEVKAKLIDEYKNLYGTDPGINEMKTIEEDARSSGNAVFLSNAALLLATNYLTFGNLLKPTSVLLKEGSRNAIKGGIGISNNLDDLIPLTRSTKLMDRFVDGFKKIPSLLKVPITEGFVEEGSEYIISESSKDYWTAKYKGSDNADQLFKSLAKGVQNTLTTREGMENIIMGALSGVLINGGSSIINRSRATLKGEKYIPSRNKAISSAIEIANSTAGLTGSISNLHNELSTTLDIQKRMEEAVISNDIEKAKNLKADAFFNWIYSANRSGLLELRMEALSDAKKIKDEEFTNFWGIDYSESNAKTAEKYIGLLEEKAKAYASISDTIENAFGKNPFNVKKQAIKYRAFEDYKQALGHSLMEVKDSKDRMTSITSELKSLYPGLDINSAMNLTTEEGLKHTIKKLNEKVEDLKVAEENSKTQQSLYSTIHKERLFLENQIDSYNKVLNGKATNEEYKQTYRKTLSYFNNTNSIDENLFPATIDDSFEQLNALNYLKNRSINALNYYTTLRNKDGFENFSKEVADIIYSTYLKRMEVKDGKLSIKSEQQVKSEEENSLIEASKNLSNLFSKMAEEKAKEVVPEIEEGITNEEIDQLNEVVVKLSNNIPLTPEEEKLTEIFPLAVERKKIEATVQAELNNTINENIVSTAEQPISDNSTPVVTTNVTDPTVIYSLFGNIFETITKENEDAWKEFNSIKKQVETTNLVSKIYNDYILNSQIFKFIFKDKSKVSSSKIVVKSIDIQKERQPTRIGTTKLYRAQSPVQATLFLNGKAIGSISNMSTIMVEKGGNIVTLESIIDDINKYDFVDITGYDVSLYETFKDSFKAYKSISDNIFNRINSSEIVDIVDQSTAKPFYNNIRNVINSAIKEGDLIRVLNFTEDGYLAAKVTNVNLNVDKTVDSIDYEILPDSIGLIESEEDIDKRKESIIIIVPSKQTIELIDIPKIDNEVEIENEIVQSLFNIMPIARGYKSTSVATDSTMLKDIQALGDNSYIISTKRMFAKDNETGNYKETFVVNVIGKEGIIKPENYEPSLKELMKDKIFVQNLKNNKSRYAILNRNPNGVFTKASKVVARPADTPLQDLQSLYNALKENNLETLFSLVEETYIADKNLPKGSKIRIDFAISEDDKVSLMVTQNNGIRKGTKFIENIKSIADIDLTDLAESTENLEEFLDELNLELQSVKDVVKIDLNKDNFKKYIADDEVVKFSDFNDTLIVSTTPYFYNEIKLAVVPKGITFPTINEVEEEIIIESEEKQIVNKTNLAESEKITIFAKEYNISDIEGISKARALQAEMGIILSQLQLNNTIQKTKCS